MYILYQLSFAALTAIGMKREPQGPLELEPSSAMFIPGAHFHVRVPLGATEEHWRTVLPPTHRPAPEEEQPSPGRGPRLFDVDSALRDPADPSSFVHAVLRTSSIPLGPNLGAYSIDGIADQKFPLVGMDRVVKEDPVTGKMVTGYWPLFGALTAGVYINKGTQSYWREVYGFNGATQTLNCDAGDVVIGVRWRSHAREAKRRAAAGEQNGAQDLEAYRDLIDIPDIQCTKLITAEVRAYGIDSTYQVTNVSYDTEQQTRDENIIASVKDVQQCMLTSVEGFMIKSDGSDDDRLKLNTCSGRLRETATPSSFLRWMLSARPSTDGSTDRKASSPQGLMEIDMGYKADPDIIEQILAGNYSFENDMFGPTNIESPAAAREEAMNKALEGMKNAWKLDKVPTIESVKESLPEKPWESSKLIVGSDQFLEGTMLGGRRAMAVTGFTTTNGMVEFVCGKIIACEKGTCRSNGCECLPGYEGPNCDVRSDPCRTRPCGKFGECVENFDKPTGYECQCQATWFGSHCETTTNMCLERIIFENETEWHVRDCGKGDCISTSGQFECSCHAGWERSQPGLTGKCDSEVQDCVGQWVGSTCNSQCMQEMTFKIFKPVRGSGTPCEHPAGKTRTEMCSWGDCKKCMGRDCNGRGTCDTTTGNCICEGIYSGDNCELERTECSDARCNGHGNCVGDGCQCVNGWTNEGPDSGPLNGIYCTKDPCDGCPEGQCDLRTGFCSCRAGTWSDVNRAAGETACELSSGTIDCVGEWGPWSTCQSDCQRRRYFTITTMPRNGGKHCPAKGGDQMQEACQMDNCCLLKDQDCLNGGTLLASSCTCLCSPGYQGSRCETKVTDADRILEREAIIDFSGDPVIPEQEPDADVVIESAQKMVEEKKSPILLILGGVFGVLVLAGAAYYYSKQHKKPKPPALDTDDFMAEVLGGVGDENLNLSAQQMSSVVELRSDTFTQPTDEMRRAMAEAYCGDDVWGMDPTVNAFQKEAADKFGFYAALYLPTATMSNLVAMLVHCEKKGSEIILGNKSHIHIYEQGGCSTIAGAHCRTVPNNPDGTLPLKEVELAIRPFESHYPITRAVCVENTHNLCGGRVLKPEYMKAIGDLCKKYGVKLHIDGSRIFNASVKLGVSVKELTKEADSVTLCLSKGLSAPLGALLLTRTEADAVLAHRFRKVLGGNMRQVGVVACCGQIAINKMVDRLAEDHKNATMLADGLAGIDGIVCDVSAVDTNMVRWGLHEKVQDRITCAKLVDALGADDGVSVKMICIERGIAIRAVTHRHITPDGITKAIEKVRRIMESSGSWPKLSSDDRVLTID
ncbi:hypothetical protein FOL47_001932 [Perkinsus chesapeaki]|uniref:EGF-like domain-containing protein n=1 Tax=Perkinsus chesapeaki TaxID=330153 RepID=A0A7J6MG77_PERCH|nr:hypothetical protein FOL47_001932 [Perkinsus chesapeaki]